MSAALIPLGNHVAVDPTKVVAVRQGDRGPQVKVEPDGAWLDATAYTGRTDRLIDEINIARARPDVMGSAR
jgi:hypothetical protein